MKLKKIADNLRFAEKMGCGMPTAACWLEREDYKWELRKRGTPKPHTLTRADDGTPVRDHYLPHIPIDAQVYARSWKALKWAAMTFGMTTSEAWTEVLLPHIESAIRDWKKGGK